MQRTVLAALTTALLLGIVTAPHVAYSWGSDVLIRSQSTTNSDLTIDEESGVLIVGFGGPTTPGSYYVYKSTDNGETWTSIVTESNVWWGSMIVGPSAGYLILALMKSDYIIYFQKRSLTGSLLDEFGQSSSHPLAYPCIGRLPYGEGTTSYVPVMYEEQYGSTDKDVWFHTFDVGAMTLANEERLDGNGSTAEFYYPQVGITSATRVAAYHSYGSGDLHWKRSTNSGVDWGSRQTLTNVSGRIRPKVCAASTNNWMIHWVASGATNYAYSTSGGSSFTYAGALTGSGLSDGCIYSATWNIVNQGSNGYCVRRYTTNPASTSWSSENISDGATGASVASIARAASGYAVTWARSGGVYFDASWRQPASLTVTSPNGGECWINGTSHDITWSSTGTIANVKIELSTNGGSSYSPIVASTTNDGSYTWTVSGTASSQCRIRISDVSASTTNDVSDANFTICNQIGVTSPTAGAVYMVGATMSIAWNTSGLSGNVKIELSTNGGSSWPVTIAASTSDDGAYSWTVGSYAGTSNKVRVTHLTYTSDYGVSGTFTIMRQITVTAPNGGENWVGGTHAIVWQSSGLTSTNVKIDLSTNSGSTWPTSVISSTSDDGTYDWTIPHGLNTTHARIRVSHLTYTSNYDASDGDFGVTGIEETRVMAPATALLGNAPEPFPDRTSIDFALHDAVSISLVVHDSEGRLLRVFDARLPAGRHSILWDGRDRDGRQMPGGVYFYRMRAGEYTATRKMVKLE
jgi:hypothetical protein